MLAICDTDEALITLACHSLYNACADLRWTFRTKESEFMLNKSPLDADFALASYGHPRK
jgi:hypothetical protein